MKVVVIGGGSSYTPELFEGFIKKRGTLSIDEIVLVDIQEGKKKLEINYNLVKRMFHKEKYNTKLSYTFNRRSAIANADFIITQIRVGGLKARALDETIPLKYDLIGQETTGAGGFAKAIRTIPVILDICKDIEEVAKKDAWLINFTNPAGIITEAVERYTNVNVLGLCNVPYNMQVNIAKSMQVPTKSVFVEFAGLNHMVYGTKVFIDGENVTSDVIDQLIKGASNSMNNIPDLTYPESLLRSLNVVPCPYHRYFYMTDQLLKEEQDAYESNGHTRGIEVMAIEEELFKLYADESLKEKPKVLEKRGGAHYSTVAISLIDAISNDKNEIHPVNTINRGVIPELPRDCVVEVNAIINKSGASPLAIDSLPKELTGLIQKVKIYEQLTIEAIMEKDRLKGIQALYHNPLVNSFFKAEKIFDEIIEANKEYLPKFIV